jgi:hypothetical protein
MAYQANTPLAMINIQRMESKKNKKEKNAGMNVSQLQDLPEESPQLSFAHMEGMCFCSSKKGHISSQCRHKSRPKNEWAINKTPELVNVQSLMAQNPGRDTESNSEIASMTRQSTESRPFLFQNFKQLVFQLHKEIWE